MYTYAFLLNSDQPLDLPEGIWGSLELVRVAQLAALVEPNLSFESLQQSDRQLMQAVLSHDRVIQEVFQQTAVLPLRFGTYFVSQRGLLDHLQSHQQEYLDKLTRLQGKAEYVLKLTPLPLLRASSETADPDKEYFWAKKRYQQQSELQSISSIISEYYPDFTRGGSANDGVERIYLLSAQQEESLLHQHLANWQHQWQYWQVNLGEPLPPYHFV